MESNTGIAVLDAPKVLGQLIPKTLGDTLMAQVKALTAKGGEITATVNAENFPRAVELIARVRAAVREIDAKYEELVADAKAAMAPINGERSDAKKSLAQIDEALEAGIMKTYETALAAGAEEALRMEGVMGSKLTIVKKIVGAHKLDVQDKSHRAEIAREAVAVMLGIDQSLLKPVSDWVDPEAVKKAAGNDPETGKPLVPGFSYTETEKRHLQTRVQEIVR